MFRKGKRGQRAIHVLEFLYHCKISGPVINQWNHCAKIPDYMVILCHLYSIISTWRWQCIVHAYAPKKCPPPNCVISNLSVKTSINCYYLTKSITIFVLRQNLDENIETCNFCGDPKNQDQNSDLPKFFIIYTSNETLFNLTPSNILYWDTLK